MLKGITISFFVDNKEEEDAIKQIVNGYNSVATIRGGSFSKVTFSGKETLRTANFTTKDPMYMYILGREVSNLINKKLKE